MRSISLFCRAFFSLRYGSRIVWGKGITMNYRFRFRGPGKLVIGDGVNLWAHQEPNAFQTYHPDAIISIGDRSRLNGTAIHCRKSVTIGEDGLSGSAILLDNDFHSIIFQTRNDPSAIKVAPIVIGKRVWLGGQCAILKGVTIGDEAVVGFRAVVTRDVPTKMVVAGNPAIVVKAIGDVA